MSNFPTFISIFPFWIKLIVFKITRTKTTIVKNTSLGIAKKSEKEVNTKTGSMEIAKNKMYVSIFLSMFFFILQKVYREYMTFFFIFKYLLFYTLISLNYPPVKFNVPCNGTVKSYFEPRGAASACTPIFGLYI